MYVMYTFTENVFQTKHPCFLQDPVSAEYTRILQALSTFTTRWRHISHSNNLFAAANLMKSCINAQVICRACINTAFHILLIRKMIQVS